MKKFSTNFVLSALMAVLVCGGCAKTVLHGEPRNEDLSSRRVLPICAPKTYLKQSDLEMIAKENKVRLDDILQANEACRVKNATETDLATENCQKIADKNCPNGILVLPLR